MDQSLELTNITTEPTGLTSIDQLEISTEMNMISVKQESDCLIQSEIYIKTEPQEDKREAPINDDTYYQMCSYDNIKFTTIKIKHEVPEHEIMQEPLDVEYKIKVEKYFPIDLDSKPRIDVEPTDEEKNEAFLQTNTDDSHRSGFSHQNQLLIRNDLNKKNKCSVCYKTFRSNYDLDRHSRIHTGAKPFTCNICEKSFNRKENLDRHMLIHSGEKPYVCDVCKKVFRDKSTLNKHKLIHIRKPFSCKDCDKSFTEPSDLVEHKRLHTDVKPYICNLCKKAFVRKSDLTKHTLIHTGEKPYCCEICSKSFARKYDIVVHNRTHTGDKPFSCEFCEKAFTNKSNLFKHRQLHTGKKPYSCDICNKRFTRKSDLYRHKKIHKK